MLATVECPYCGEPYEIIVDCSGGSQDYIEDCPVCCRPVEIRLEANSDGELLPLAVRRDDD